MHFKSCCCGCRLKTGTLLIGILCAVGSLYGLIKNILGASVGTEEIQKELVELGKQRDTMSSAEYDEAMKELEAASGYKTLSVLFICLAIFYGIHLIFDILLVIGAIAEHPRMIKAWIVVASVSLGVETIMTLVIIIIDFISGTVIAGFLALVILGVVIAITGYFILVVHSFHTQLLSNNVQNEI